MSATKFTQSKSREMTYSEHGSNGTEGKLSPEERCTRGLTGTGG